MFKKLALSLIILFLGFTTVEAQELGFLEIQTPTYSIVNSQPRLISADITLNNGSKWNVSGLPAKGKVLKWTTEDSITATYHSYYKGHFITLKNNTNQESTIAEFIKQTEINNETVFIHEIDLNQSIITLNNGVRYKVQDEARLFGLWVTSAKTQIQKWEIGDPVMVLLKSKSNNHLLFNTAMVGFFSSTEIVAAQYLED